MPKNLAVVVVVAALIGCGGSVEKPAAVAPPVAAPVAAKSQEVVEVVTPPVAVVPVVAVSEPTPTLAVIPPAAEPEQPKESRKATAFKEKVANYLEEARAGAKLMTIGAT